MSRLIRLTFARSTAARRMLQAVRRSCTQARLTDRDLMAMHTDLSRNSGWGCHGA